MSQDNKDDFWDLDKLLPRKRPSVRPFATSTPISEITVQGSEEESEDAKGQGRITLTSDVYDDGAESYCPEYAGLIRRVTVRHRRDKYDFYESFRKAALLYFDYYTPKSPFVKFYSYMPQYSQLNEGQKNYYFYWRYMVRRGVYLQTDYSYLYLLVYEILNLPDKIPPVEGVKLLCTLWREYRRALPRLDAYFSIWVQDYCLVHKLPCPTAEIEDFIFVCVNSVSFKEFYLSDISEASDGGVLAAMSCFSDYDWRSGKFVNGNGADSSAALNSAVRNAEDYKRLMLGAMRRITSTMTLTPADGGTSVLRRDAFPNCLCTMSVKCNLEIEYCPISSAEGIRRRMTGAVRYTENKLRALMGVKSRLAVKDLDSVSMRMIDEYFSSYDSARRIAVAKANAPEYERLYDAPEGKLSLEDADAIEQASWGVTARLTDGIDDPESVNIPTPIPLQDRSEESEKEYDSITPKSRESREGVSVGRGVTDTEGDSYGLCPSDIEFVRRVLTHSVAVGLDADSSAERINEAFSDNLGDVVLECDGEVYTLIDDYREDVIEWLEKITK